MVNEHLKDLDLQGIERRPVYSLRMAGPTPSTALPSIVVTCQRADVRRLQDLFRSRAETRLPVGKGPSRSPFRRALAGKQRRHDDDPSPQIRFRLVYYGVQASTVLRKASRDIPEVYYPGDLKGLRCGGLVGYQQSSATLGLLIDVGRERAILTVDHLFSRMKPPENGRHQFNYSGSLLSDKLDGLTCTNEEESESLFELLEDDDEYDELLEEDAQRLDQTEVLSSTSKEPDKETLGQFRENCEKLTPLVTLSPWAPYLDWALVIPSSGPLGGINTVRLPGNHHLGRDPTKLTKVRHEPPSHLAGVYLVSGVRGVLGGRILSGSTFLPSFSGQESCEAWTVVLDDSNRLVDGECGAIVVDRETFEVYGHVVGSDDLGFPYVIPLSRVLDQIRTSFGTSAALASYDLQENQRVGSTITAPSPRVQVFPTEHHSGRKRTASSPTKHIHFSPKKTPKEDQKTLVFSAHQQSSKRGKSWEPSRKTYDDWSKVIDPEERRRIQNRIAQRKFREKARERKELEQRDRLNQQNSSLSYHLPFDPNQLPQDEGGELSGLPWGGASMSAIMAEGHAPPGDQGSGLAPNEFDSNWDGDTSYLSPYSDSYTNRTTATTSTTTTTTTTTASTSTGITPASTTTGTEDSSHGDASPYSTTQLYWDYHEDRDNNDDYYHYPQSYYEYEEKE